MMTKPDAEIILGINDLQWITLEKLINDERKVIQDMLENPTNPRDLDMLHKGALGFSKQVLGYRETALKIINPKKEDQE